MQKLLTELPSLASDEVHVVSSNPGLCRTTAFSAGSSSIGGDETGREEAKCLATRPVARLAPSCLYL